MAMLDSSAASLLPHEGLSLSSESAIAAPLTPPQLTSSPLPTTSSSWWGWAPLFGRRRTSSPHVSEHKSSSTAPSEQSLVTVAVLAALTAAMATVAYRAYHAHTQPTAPARRRPQLKPCDVSLAAVKARHAPTLAQSETATQPPTATSWGTATSDCGLTSTQASRTTTGTTGSAIQHSMHQQDACDDEGNLRKENEENYVAFSGETMKKRTEAPQPGTKGVCTNNYADEHCLSPQGSSRVTWRGDDVSEVSAAAAASPPPLASPRPAPDVAPSNVLLRNYYDLEPYTQHGMAAGAHGWPRVFGLLSLGAASGQQQQQHGGGAVSDEEDDQHYFDRVAAASQSLLGRSGTQSGCAVLGLGSLRILEGRAPRSLTCTHEGSRVTANEYPSMLRNTLTTSMAAMVASRSTVPSAYRSGTSSDATVQSSGTSVWSSATTYASAGPPAASSRLVELPNLQRSGRRLSSVSPSALSTTTPLQHSLHSEARAAPPAHILQHLTLSGSRSISNATESTSEHTSNVTATAQHATALSPNALARAQRNLQKDISTLVATTAAARPTPASPTSAATSAPRHRQSSVSSRSPSTSVTPRPYSALPSAHTLASGRSALPSAHTLASGRSSRLGSSSALDALESAAPLSARTQVLGAAAGASASVESRTGAYAERQVLASRGVSRVVRPERPGVAAGLRLRTDSVPAEAGVERHHPLASFAPLPPSVPAHRSVPAPLLSTAGAAGGLTFTQKVVNSEDAASEEEQEPFSPTTVARRRTIAQQLALLTRRREQQHQYTQQLHSPAALSSPAGALSPTHGGVPPSAYGLSSVYEDGRSMRPALGGSGGGGGVAQCFTDTSPGVYYSSLLQPYHFENQVHSDVTTEVQQCKRRRLRERGANDGAAEEASEGVASAEVHRVVDRADTGAAEVAQMETSKVIETTVTGATPLLMPPQSQEKSDDSISPPASSTAVVGEAIANTLATAGPFVRTELPRTSLATTLSSTIASASPRGGESVVSASTKASWKSASAARHAFPSTSSTAASATTPATATVSVPPPSILPQTPSQKSSEPPHDRRVDDLTVKHQDDGSASYSISLTYHDSATGTSRTVNTSALPPLRRSGGGGGGHAAPPIPGLSSQSDSSLALPLAAAAAKMSRPTAAAAGAATAAAGARGRAISPSPARDVATEAARPSLSAYASEGVVEAERRQSTSPSNTTGVMATRGNRARPAAAEGLLGVSSNPFAAPLPPTEPQHGPRLQGVAGRNGEMAIGAFLGGGACGKVYECLNTETGQVLAAKQIVFDAKDRKLRTRLKQLELELEVLTLAARHHVQWIVGFFGAEKRGHSVLMYLEYCQRGSLLDYMVEGNSADVAVWGEADDGDAATHEGPTSGGRRATTAAKAPAAVGVTNTSRYDAHGNASPAAVDPWRLTEADEGAANCLITDSTLQGLRRAHQNQLHGAPPNAVGGNSGLVVEEGGGTQGHRNSAAVGKPARTRLEEDEDDEFHVRRGSTTASTSSANRSMAYSSSTWDTMPLSEALHPQMPPLSIEQVQCFTKQIVEGLRFMHTHHYAHLDVKTANVLVTEDEQCRLADLGCAMRLQPPSNAAAATEGPTHGDALAHANSSSASSTSTPPTATYPVLVDHDAITELRGTALYMAPEMIRFESHAIGSPADIWSLGCVVMEMATGCAPWRHIAKDKLRVLYRIGSARGELPLPPLMRAWAEEASDWLAYEKGMTASVAARDVAVEPSVLPCSAKKDALVEEEEGGHLRRRESSGETAGAGGVPDRQRRRLEDGPTVAGVAGNEEHVDAAREHISSPERDCDSPSSLLMTRCNTSAALAPSTLSRTASPTPASVLPVAPVPHCSAKVGTHATDSDEEAASAEEQLLRSQSRVMQLYVELQSFVSACVKVRPEDRSSAEELLNHPFLTL